MSDHANTERRDSPAEYAQSESDAVDSIESYETEDGVVFYDAQNPMAWLQASTTVTLREQA